MADIFVDPTLAVLAKTLDGAAARQQVLADNIANAETPNYHRKDLAFEDELRAAMSQPNGDVADRIADIEHVATRVAEDQTAPANPAGNTVNVEREMAALAKNSLQYEAATQLLNMKYRGLNRAIREGKG